MSLDQQFEEDDKKMSFLDHLEVLRWHLIRSVIAIFIGTILAFVFKSIVFDTIVLAPTNDSFITYLYFCKFSYFVGFGDKLCFDSMQFNVINISMAGQFTMHLIVSIVSGIILAFPYILFEVWRFLKPALKKSEHSFARGIVFWGSFLFLTGVAFGYYLITPLSVQFLGGYTVSDLVKNQISLNSYISTITTITLSCGIIFQLPIVVYFLSNLGIVTPQLLKTYRKHSVVVVLILAAIITPPDVMSQVLVSMPLFVLYEISIWISRAVQKKNESSQ